MQPIVIELEPQSLSNGSNGSNNRNSRDIETMDRKSRKQNGSFTTIRQIRNSREKMYKSRVALSQCTVHISEDSRHHDIAHCKGIANVGVLCAGNIQNKKLTASVLTNNRTNIRHISPIHARCRLNLVIMRRSVQKTPSSCTSCLTNLPWSSSSQKSTSSIGLFRSVFPTGSTSHKPCCSVYVL